MVTRAPAVPASSSAVLGRYASLEAFAAALAFIDVFQLAPYGGALRVHPDELDAYAGEDFAQLALCCADLGLHLVPDADLTTHRAELIAHPAPARGYVCMDDAVLRPL